MFGYINVNKSELSEENQKIYQAYYCGLCQHLHHNCGMKGQMLLSYDMTFLLMLLSGLYEPETTKSSCKCIAHPFEEHVSHIICKHINRTFR